MMTIPPGDVLVAMFGGGSQESGGHSGTRPARSAMSSAKKGTKGEPSLAGPGHNVAIGVGVPVRQAGRMWA